MADINLNPVASEDGEDQKDRKARRAESRAKREGERKRRTPPAVSDRDLTDKLTDAFERIAESREARGDEELATIVREDAEVMTKGLVSLSRTLKPLRFALMMFASVIQPLLAFRRIVRITLERWALRRGAATRAEESEPE